MNIFHIALLFLPLIFASHRLKLDALEITSSAFKNNSTIPIKYTLYGDNVSPELHISNIPEDMQSLALILEDPDAPGGTWVHYIVKNIPKSKNYIKENEKQFGDELINSFGYSHYGGPKPPNSTGIHHYYWKFYALDEENMSANSIEEFRAELDAHKITEGYLMGTYEKK